MNMPFQPYNVVLIPPKAINEEAIRLSKLIAKKHPAEFVLDGKNFYPHLTLFQLTIPSNNLVDIKDLLNRILTASVNLKFSRYYGAETGFLSWDCEGTKELLSLHKDIILKTNKWRRNKALPAKKLKYNFLTTNDKKQIKNFGSSGLFENFRPHITITRLKDGKDYKNALKVLPIKEPQLVKFTKAALGELSTHGTVIKIISEYKLK